MNKRIVLCLLAPLAVFGCQVKEENEFTPENKTFTATMETMIDGSNNVGTKTSMDNEGNVLWKQGDQVSIFVGSTINQRFQVTDASDGKTAAALNPIGNTGSANGEQISTNVAFYPYSSTATIAQNGSTYVINDIELPAIQNYAHESFGNGAFPMAAVTSSARDYNLKFKNVLGGLKLQLKGTATIASISVTGNNNEKLCGAAEVTVSTTSAPSLTMKDASAKAVTLNCGDGVQLDASTATVFIIALPPMTMSGGFTVIVTDTEGASMEIKTTKSQTITRSNLLSMPVVTYEGIIFWPEYVDLGLPSGLKWATCNLCETGFVSSPEEYGDYYAWGETEPYYEDGYAQSNIPVWKTGKGDGYYWTSYKFRTTGETYDTAKVSKYNTNSSYGIVDNITEFSYYNYIDDAARQTLGGSWRMPTDDEWNELLDECIWTWTTQKGVYGRLVTGPNGNNIFLPAAGGRYDTVLGNTGTVGAYWSCSLSTVRQCEALYSWLVFFNSDDVRMDFHGRFLGRSVRPVTDEGVRIPVESVSIDHDSINLIEGDYAALTATVLPSDATQPSVLWSSSDRSIATVDYNGVVTAVGSGNATITATTYDRGLTATCQVTVTAIPVAVDLGLTSGLKWASYNVGASSPEGYGDYFAWGETAPYYTAGHSLDSPCSNWEGNKTGYNIVSYKFRTSGDSYETVKFSKYVIDYWLDFGTADNKTVLEPEDDVAYVNYGGAWRMPTDAEWDELIDECTWTWTTQNEVNGYLVTGTNGNSIFLPAAGNRDGIYLDGTGSYCYYWSSSLDAVGQIGPYCAWYVSISEGAVHKYLGGSRCSGMMIRPVSDEGVRISVTGVSLSKNYIYLLEGGTASLTATVTPSNATQPTVIWSSSDTSVATVDYTGMVTAVAVGSTTITAKTYDGGFTSTCTVTVYGSSAGTINGYGWVDLGLTSGLKWASCNVGANAPEEYGDYFAWGETEPYYTAGHSQDSPCSDWRDNKTGYNWASYKFELGTGWQGPFSKYVTDNPNNIGNVDNKAVLDPEDDAAIVYWGGTWRMPTDAEWTELRTKCTWTWTTQNGANGRLVTGPNGNSIFLPAAGERNNTNLNDSGSDGYYWSSSLSSYNPDHADGLCFSSGNVGGYGGYRCSGLSVRPVSE